MKHLVAQTSNEDGAILNKHGNIHLGTLRKIYGSTFAAGHPDSAELNVVLVKLNETSLSQLRRDYATKHLDKKISKVLA